MVPTSRVNRHAAWPALRTTSRGSGCGTPASRGPSERAPTGRRAPQHERGDEPEQMPTKSATKSSACTQGPWAAKKVAEERVGRDPRRAGHERQGRDRREPLAPSRRVACTAAPRTRAPSAAGGTPGRRAPSVERAVDQALQQGPAAWKPAEDRRTTIRMKASTPRAADGARRRRRTSGWWSPAEGAATRPPRIDRRAEPHRATRGTLAEEELASLRTALAKAGEYIMSKAR